MDIELQPEVEQQKRTRDKKVNERNRNLDEHTRNTIKQMKLCHLEEDEVGYKEDKKEDSDFDDNSSVSEKEKKRKKRIKKTAADTIHYGRLNLVKYFLYDKEDIDMIFPNYNNITVKSSNKFKYKICNVCYNFAEYTCPKCLDKYCSRHCFKTHVEVKCVQYLDV